MPLTAYTWKKCLEFNWLLKCQLKSSWILVCTYPIGNKKSILFKDLSSSIENSLWEIKKLMKKKVKLGNKQKKKHLQILITKEK